MKKVLKYLLIFVGVVVVAFVVGNFLTDGKLSVSQSLQMDAPPQAVFKHVNNFKNWEAWSPWKASDSTMVMEYGEIVEGEGASYQWVGEKNGEGKMKIAESTPYSQIKTEVYFSPDPTADPSHGTWTFEEKDGGTLVTWAFDAQFPWMQHMLVLMFKDPLKHEIGHRIEQFEKDRRGRAKTGD